MECTGAVTPGRQARTRRTRTVLTGVVLAGVLGLTGCTGSGSDEHDSAHPSSSRSSSGSPTSALTAPITADRVSARTNAAIQKLIPLLPGVQNVTYEQSDRLVSVYFRPSVTKNERTVVAAQLDRLTGRTATAPRANPSSSHTG